MKTAKDKMIGRIRRLKRGAVFTPMDFLDIASRGTIDMTLGSLLAKGEIRRLARGIYDSPRRNELLGGPSPPRISEIAQALARRFRWTIMPEGATAANLLGLSTQVPARAIFLSSGPSKVVEVGGWSIQFKHARPREAGVLSPRVGGVIQALRHLGRQHVDARVIEKLSAILSSQDKRALVRESQQSAEWIRKIAAAINSQAAP